MKTNSVIIVKANITNLYESDSTIHLSMQPFIHPCVVDEMVENELQIENMWLVLADTKILSNYHK